jgi:hypothetical protein
LCQLEIGEEKEICLQILATSQEKEEEVCLQVSGAFSGERRKTLLAEFGHFLNRVKGIGFLFGSDQETTFRGHGMV